MRTTHKLTPRKVRQLLTKGKPGRWNDGGGLYLQVSQWATGAWVFRYEIDGRSRMKGLGSVNDFTLAEARKRAETARKLLKGGDDPTKRIDPIEAAREARDKSRAEARERQTFREAAEEFIAVHAPTWKNEKHKQQWPNSLRDYAYRALSNRPVAAIDAALINETVAPIWTTKIETARRVKGRIERVCKWVRDGKPLPQKGVKAVKHHSAMPYSQVPALVAELRQRQSVSAKALEFLILTAARTSEVIGATWSEIDTAKKLWVVPQSRMKAGVEHRVPLCDRALELLAELPREKGNAHMFVGLKGAGLSNAAMAKLLKQIDGNGFTPHGMRSAFKDWAVEQCSLAGVHELSEAALAHRIKDKVQAAYERGDKLAKRVKLMEHWARYCDEPVEASGKVLTMKRA